MSLSLGGNNCVDVFRLVSEGCRQAGGLGRYSAEAMAWSALYALQGSVPLFVVFTFSILFPVTHLG